MPAATSALVCSSCGAGYAAEHSGDARLLPRILPCGHTVCTACAAASLEAGTSFTLPLHTMSAVPGAAPRDVRVGAVACPCGCPPVPVGPGGAEALPLDIATAEAVAEGAQPAKETLCDECEEGTATLWCELCQSVFCPDCLAKVHAPRVMQRHKSVPIEERPPPADMCPHHPRQERTMFCNTCTDKACALCCDERFGGKHVGEGHSVVPLDQAASAAVERLRGQLHKLQQRRQRLTASAQRTAATLAGVEPSRDSAVRAVEAQFAEMRKQVLAALDQREKALLAEVEGMAQTKRDKLARQVADIGVALSRVTRACSVCEVRLRGNPLEVLDVQATFLRQLGDAVRTADSCSTEPVVEVAGVPVHFDSAAVRSACSLVLTHGAVGRGEGPRVTAVTAGEEGPKQVAVTEEEERRARQRLSGNGKLPSMRGSRRRLLGNSSPVKGAATLPGRAGFRDSDGRVVNVTTQADQRGEAAGLRNLLTRRHSAPVPLSQLADTFHTYQAQQPEAPVGLSALRSLPVGA
eukprot:TRINITY_DN10969_c0_g1_i1.p1 TRINITY_DN10969_c0_g1~~TRINITY_DN10969_c0_g1_i1.p1  ORF type:complete len:522 (+),score=131.64 TRINITY_DN10969_c0_g1_i1:86-1651(+)